MPPLGRNSLRNEEPERPAVPIDTTAGEPQPQAVDRPADATYHDSLSGRSVDKQGNFTDGQGEGPIPEHRIVSDSWAEDREDKPDEDDAL